MGWSGGSELMNELIDAMNDEKIDAYAQHRIYMRVIESFESADCDTLCECLGRDPVFDDAYFTLNPDVREYYEKEK